MPLYFLDFNGQWFRATRSVKGGPLFSLADTCRCLGFKDLQKLEQELLVKFDVTELTQVPVVNAITHEHEPDFVDESQLFWLINHALVLQHTTAASFSVWVVNVVLPTLYPALKRQVANS